MLIITAAQCRAGRSLVELTQPQLATAAGLGLSTVVDFEKGRREVSAQAIAAIANALEAGGVIFIDENGEGPGVRLRKQRALMSDELFWLLSRVRTHGEIDEDRYARVINDAKVANLLLPTVELTLTADGVRRLGDEEFDRKTLGREVNADPMTD